MLPQIFRVSSTLTLTSSKHWGTERDTTDALEHVPPTPTKPRQVVWFSPEGRKKISKWKPSNTNLTRKPNMNCQRCSLTRRYNVFAAFSKTSGRRSCKCIWALDSLSFAKQRQELSPSLRGVALVTDFMTRWHQLPALAAISFCFGFFFSFPLCEAAVSARWSHNAMQGRMSEPPRERGRKGKSENSALFTRVMNQDGGGTGCFDSLDLSSYSSLTRRDFIKVTEIKRHSSA